MVAANYGVDAELYAAELRFGVLFANQAAEPQYAPLPRFPAVTRDLALVCNLGVSVGELTECITAAGGELLRDVRLFDVYTGPGIPDGKKSVAFSLTLRADDGTLTDERTEPVIQSVLSALKEKLGAVIR